MTRLRLAIAALLATAGARAEIPASRARVAETPLQMLYVERPSVLAAGASVSRSTVTFAGGGGALRPLAANLLGERGVVESGGWVGSGRGTFLTLRGMSDRPVLDGAYLSGALLGAGYALHLSQMSSFAVTAGYLRDLSLAQGVWARVSAEWRTDHLLATAMAHSEHVFRAGRDSLDLVVVSGCYYLLNEDVHLGAEYIGQDLEGWFEPEELEGLRQFVGPVVAWRSRQTGLQVVAGPSLGISASSTTLVSRISAGYAFR